MSSSDDEVDAAPESEEPEQAVAVANNTVAAPNDNNVRLVVCQLSAIDVTLRRRFRSGAL